VGPRAGLDGGGKSPPPPPPAEIRSPDRPAHSQSLYRTLLKGVNEFISVPILLDRRGSIRKRKSLGVREKLRIV
jgi:hypothetical protein